MAKKIKIKLPAIKSKLKTKAYIGNEAAGMKAKLDSLQKQHIEDALKMQSLKHENDSLKVKIRLK